MAAHSHWAFDPFSTTLLLLVGLCYAVGRARLSRRAGAGRGAPRWEAIAFACGWVGVLVALCSPVASLSEVLFSLHMTQHEILMLVAAPLLVLGRPLSAFLWILTPRGRAAAGDFARSTPVRPLWRFLTGALVVWVLHAAAVWIWHVPALYEAAVRSPALHVFEHVCFLFTACLFWWALIHGRYGRMGYGIAVLYVFLTAIHTGALGALLTFSPRVLYPLYAERGAGLHVNPLADQQLAGLIMWIPFGVVFLVIALALFAAWMGESERRVQAVRRTRIAPGAALLPLLLLLALPSCRRAAEKDARRWAGGNVDRGAAAIQRRGCGSCHQIPGVPGANARVGPDLSHFAAQAYVAGRYPNEPGNLVAWIRNPQHLQAGTAMPELGLSEAEARDMATYLYTLR